MAVTSFKSWTTTIKVIKNDVKIKIKTTSTSTHYGKKSHKIAWKVEHLQSKGN